MPNSPNTPVEIELDGAAVPAHLAVPQQAEAIVILAGDHPAADALAGAFSEKQLGTLRVTWPDESASPQSATPELDGHTRRLIEVVAWLRQQDAARNCKIGYCAFGHLAGPALHAAAEQPDIAAVVVFGGLPGTADDNVLGNVHAPTLLIAGADDRQVVASARQAEARLGGTSRVAILDGGDSQFNNEQQREKLTEAAAQWFKDHLLY